MRKCILGCPKGNTLHKFPEDKEKRKEWLKIINMENCPLANLYLCTRHFTRRMKGKTRIVWNAVPTINLQGVDNDNEMECEEVEHDDDDFGSTRSVRSPLKETKKLSTLSNKTKVVESRKGKIKCEAINKTPAIEEQLVKHQLKFVDGKALKLSPKRKLTTKNESIETEEKRSTPSKTKTSTRNMAKKTMPDIVIKHQLKIVNGKAYKINAPVTSTVLAADEGNYEINPKMPSSASENYAPQLRTSVKLSKKTTTPGVKPTQVKRLAESENEKFSFRKSNFSPDSVQYEIVDKNEPIENEESILFTDQFDGDLDDNSIGSYKQHAQNIDGIFTNYKEDEDSNVVFETDNGEEVIYKCVEKKQNIEFGNKIRSRPRQKCGFIECFVNNNTFCMTCSHCGNEFELWDWQQFIEHVIEHMPKRKPHFKNNKLEVSSENETQQKITTTELTQELVEEDEFLTPKLEEDDIGMIEVIETGSMEKNLNVLNENVENMMQEEDSIEAYTDAIPNDYELCDEEDWEVDKLEEYEDISIYEGHESNMDDIDDNAEEEDDEYRAEEEAYNNIEDGVSPSVIDFKTTDRSRVLQFINLLATQPVLWHPRRYGPPIYDDEMKIFLSKFDDSMSPLDFRRSMEHLRYQYKRFTPLTSRGRVKLQQDAFLRECIQKIKEIADKLSKPFAFHCNICRFCFLDENRMLTHKYLKHKIGDLKFICSCGIRFAFQQQKDEHEDLHKLKPRFTCELCDSNFIFNRLLRDHMNECHPETQENPMPYTCTNCDAKFPSILKRAHHMERHKIPKYHCEICNQSYRTSFRFKHHLKRHQNQRDWVCEHCGKAFVERRSLNAHLFRVHRDGGLKCVYCRTFFAGQESLDAHNRKFHPGGTNLDRMKNIRKYFNTKYKYKNGEPQYKRIFKCKECSELFKNMWSLVEHKRHTGHDLQAYNCPNCDAVLSSPKTLMGHLRRIHKLQVTTMAELRKLLLQSVEEEQLTAGEEVEEDADGIEIFEVYDIE